MRPLLSCVITVGLIAMLFGCAEVPDGQTQLDQGELTPGEEPSADQMPTAEEAKEPARLWEGVGLLSDPEQEAGVLAMAEGEREGEAPAELVIDYPMVGSVFPPEIIAPTFLWHDNLEQTDRWLIDVSLEDGSRLCVLSDGPPPPEGEIDTECLAANNTVYVPTPYQASARSWTPSEELWEAIKAGSSGQWVNVTVVGFDSQRPGEALSRGRMRMMTSTDAVGAPILYRDVPLIPAKNEKGNIKPLPDYALRLVTWRLRDVSRQENRPVLRGIPTCASCHSFSTDGRTLAMDIDGPSGDKGAYGIAEIKEKTVITTNDIVTWNSYPEKTAGHKTIGLMSQISPDGRYAVSTVNESIYSAGFTDFRFLQVFFPTRGILACYDGQTGQFFPLPGAADTEYVQCDPVWLPDGEWIVFARAKAMDSYIKGRKEPEYANHKDETPMQYDLYRIPFNGGKGGEPERIEGASQNGMSNTFPKVSPDGKWIVFVKCRNGQLQRPDSRLWIVPVSGGQAREMNCNMSLMNSWHSFSPNGRWMVFSSKNNTPYTQMFLTHIDEDGNDSPAILISEATAANRAVNLPEFVNMDYDDLVSIDIPAIEYYRHYELGNKLQEEGRYAEAAEEFRKALAAEPTSTRINNSLGMCLVRMGKADEAIQCFQTALDLFPDDPRMATVYCNLGLALAAKNELDLAKEQYDKALEFDPRSVLAHLNMAEALAAEGKPDEAIKWCNKALEIEPSARAHYVLGRLLYDKGKAVGDRSQIIKAIEHWRQTVEIAPDYTTAYSNMGAAMAELGHPDQAIALYHQALERDPNHLPSRINLGIVLAKQGKPDEAIEQYRKALALAPDSTYLLNTLGIALARQGQIDEAIELFSKAVEIDPADEASSKNLNTAKVQKRRMDSGDPSTAIP